MGPFRLSIFAFSAMTSQQTTKNVYTYRAMRCGSCYAGATLPLRQWHRRVRWVGVQLRPQERYVHCARQNIKGL